MQASTRLASASTTQPIRLQRVIVGLLRQLPLILNIYVCIDIVVYAEKLDTPDGEDDDNLLRNITGNNI
jgi:hypothetical protein